MNLNSDILKSWINPVYLDPEYIETLKETAKAKPDTKYLVLDNFFNKEKLDDLIKSYDNLEFMPPPEPRYQEKKVIYDADAVHAEKDPNKYFGSELFFSEDFHRYISSLIGLTIESGYGSQLRLRSHKPDSNGFWIHTDKHGNGTPKYMVALGYFNKNWKVEDGGLFQLWRLEEVDYPNAVRVSPSESLELLNNTRINVSHPGGNFPNNEESKDMVMIDQIVPSYNRLVLINFKNSPAFHSINPSHGKNRKGFVLWLTEPKNQEEV
jgi:Rps23 Pro-64 3,4-dihydroxylase Tpa1-like proline 4-hydroxylase